MKRPICFIDIEATGKDRETDRIIEISVLKLMPDGTKTIATTRVKPEIPVSPGAFEVHGISDDALKDCKPFKDIAVRFHNFIVDCDIAGFNSNNYDVPMLYHEFRRVGIELDYKTINLIDVGNIMKIHEPRTLVAAAMFYCNKNLEDAHSAEADIMATYEVFLAQIERYGEDLPAEIDELAKHSNYDRDILDLSGKFVKNDAGVICYNFGKHKDCPVTDHLDFLDWMLNKASFNADTCKIGWQILEEYNKPK